MLIVNFNVMIVSAVGYLLKDQKIQLQLQTSIKYRMTEIIYTLDE